MKSNRIGHIFTYGTLMASDRGPRGVRERARIAAQCIFVGSATIRGRMFDTGPYPAVLLDAGRGERVHGEIWQLPRHYEDLLAALDAYEGCAPDSPQPQPYARSSLRLRAPDGRRLTAWIYLWVAPVQKLPRIADGRWRSAQRINAGTGAPMEAREPLLGSQLIVAAPDP